MAYLNLQIEKIFDIHLINVFNKTKEWLNNWLNFASKGIDQVGTLLYFHSSSE